MGKLHSQGVPFWKKLEVLADVGLLILDMTIGKLAESNCVGIDLNLCWVNKEMSRDPVVTRIFGTSQGVLYKSCWM
jgi:hypothetical protein